MDVPVTSAFDVDDLMPVASHDTSPVPTLEDAELKSLLCADDEYCSRLLEKYRRTRHAESGEKNVCLYDA